MHMSMRGVAASTVCLFVGVAGAVARAAGHRLKARNGARVFPCNAGKTTTKEDIDYTVEALKSVVKMLREMSPLYDEMKGERQCTVKK